MILASDFGNTPTRPQTAAPTTARANLTAAVVDVARPHARANCPVTLTFCAGSRKPAGRSPAVLSARSEVPSAPPRGWLASSYLFP
jgi:hypothetical protein